MPFTIRKIQETRPEIQITLRNGNNKTYFRSLLKMSN